MAKKEQPELLKLLNARAAWSLPPFRKPKFNANERAKIETAVSLHAQAFNSDPFAADRMNLHLISGLERADDVIEDARHKLGARQVTQLAAE